MNDNKPIADNFTITNLEMLKVISNPLRLQIIELIQQANRDGRLASAKQLASQQQQSLTKLYYHLKLLEKHGFIEVAETLLSSGIPEKFYRLTAERITVSEEIFTKNASREETSDALLAMVDTILGSTRDSFKKLVTVYAKEEFPEPLKPVDTHFNREPKQLSIKQAQAFHARLSALVAEFEQLEPDSDEDEQFTFGLTTLFYPIL